MHDAFARLRAASRTQGAPTLPNRLKFLSALELSILRRQDAFADAASRDFGHRSRFETLLVDVFGVLSAIRHARVQLAEWSLPERRETSWIFWPAVAEVVSQPLGVVGVISPYNFPLRLALSPLVSALAAGNRVMVKPSELAPETSRLIAEAVAEALPDDFAAVVQGGAEVGKEFAGLPFDHLVFTGSREVGRQVMRAAAENLVPVTLELGGKSPVIVGSEASVATAARRTMAGKTVNAGQACVAPDYALVPEGVAGAFVERCAAEARALYPTLADNPDYTAIASEARAQALAAMIEDARARGAKVVTAHSAEEVEAAKAKRKVAPTVLVDVKPDMVCMQQEVFGPVLPVGTYRDLSEAIAFVNARDRPLALYYFGHDEDAIARVLSETTSGGVTLNDTMLHPLQDDLPFGGVGASGMGHYQGRDGFVALSHKKGVFHQSALSATGLFRAPYGGAAGAALKLLVGPGPAGSTPRGQR